MLKNAETRELWRNRCSRWGTALAIVVGMITIATFVYCEVLWKGQAPTAKLFLWGLALFWAFIIPFIFWLEYVLFFDRNDEKIIEDQWRLLDVSRNLWAGFGLLLFAYLTKS
jgi:hypothetical protein